MDYKPAKIIVNFDNMSLSGDNPLTHMRTLLGMSVPSLAKAVGIADNIIRYTEMGIVSKITLKIHHYLSSRISNYCSADIDKIYDNWLFLKRSEAKAKGEFKDIDLTKIISDSPDHPFKQLIILRDISILAFCNLIKIPKNQLYLYISGKQETMPAAIHAALIQAGVSSKTTDTLDRLGQAHYYLLLNGRVNERRADDGIKRAS